MLLKKAWKKDSLIFNNKNYAVPRLFNNSSESVYHLRMTCGRKLVNDISCQTVDYLQ